MWKIHPDPPSRENSEVTRAGGSAGEGAGRNSIRRGDPPPPPTFPRRRGADARSRTPPLRRKPRPARQGSDPSRPRFWTHRDLRPVSRFHDRLSGGCPDDPAGGDRPDQRLRGRRLSPGHDISPRSRPRLGCRPHGRPEPGPGPDRAGVRIFFEAVRRGYLELAARETHRIRVLDGSQPPGEIAAQILSHLTKAGLLLEARCGAV